MESTRTGLQAVLQHLPSVYPFDPNRVVLAGDSHGARGVVDVVLEQPGSVRGIVLANTGGGLATPQLRKLAAVTDLLAELGGPPEPPARLHGDLWAGNRLVDATGRSWLIDPAAHASHREFDLAMMRLFGGFGADCFAAYADEFPLADGWRARVPLHQLAPLVVHAIKFGGGYAGATERALDALLAG